MYRKSGLLTIGKEINSINDRYHNNDDYFLLLGQTFVNEQLEGKLTGKDVNTFMFGSMWDKIILFCIKHDISTKWIEAVSGKAKCKVRYIVKENLAALYYESSLIIDACHYLKKFIYIESVLSVSNKEGLALLLKIKKLSKDIPILINAGYLFYGDYACINESEECYQRLDKLVKYYERIGFRDVNNFIGRYEESRTMIWCTDDVLKYIN